MNHVATELHISIESVKIIREDDNEVVMEAVAVDTHGRRFYGIKTQPKFREGKPNMFWFENAYQKSQRNAQKGFVPAVVIEDAILAANGQTSMTYEQLESAYLKSEQGLSKAREMFVEQRNKIEELEKGMSSLEIKYGIANPEVAEDVEDELIEGGQELLAPDF